MISVNIYIFKNFFYSYKYTNDKVAIA